ncbi:low-affinity inorganic phosphate transporter [Aquipluma nitroreducens]|uniref:Phosphate transporter n=1 Tax=Aquipluma nitroreducens TaxID=2010828 RepID=A0A5K7S9Q3_9BACT|nr:inorganic phosphate transporter [Aquipluma nitroreducens]BBE18311.1 low-affinity inorganic phosphate transporter [Aquipluma nitroreducens]
MSIYIFFLVVLFILAISDLTVGVANDAVNFLNSAIGSKVATRRVIMIVASVGIMVGALFANGMMEVARKGLFYPQYYLFTEIIIIYMAVMFTDVLLLDFFNTFGLPTSTTVSLVFGLLGAAIGMAFIKVGEGDTIMVDGVQKIAQISDYINSTKALTIISSILLSVVFSFVFGVVIQWLSRLLFSFNIEKTIKYYGALWGGLAISAITYFILIKGVKDASFMTAEMYAMIKENTLAIIGLSFVFWAFFLQLLSWILKVNPLKVVVLVGTFALAMAFAGNDLVNFVGVPLAGLESFKIFSGNGGNDLLMGKLLGDIKTPSYFLIIAGIIMLIVLWFSKKAQTVIETSLSLSRQDEGTERFGSSAFSRVLVRRVVNTGTFFSQVIPQPIINKISSRFDTTKMDERSKKDPNPPMFDMVRASVNMMVASILIAIGTSYKLPLSTTYVTFMVAMSTSLVDGAWGRDSAVYRITGVFTVVGGWFITGLAAFSVAFFLSLFMGWAQVFGVVSILFFAILAFYRTHLLHKKREEEFQTKSEDIEDIPTVNQMFETNNKGIEKNLNLLSDIFSKTIKGLVDEDRKELKKQLKISVEMEQKLVNKKSKIHQTINSMPSDSIEASYFYILTLDYLKELAHAINYMAEPVFNHVDNNHKPILPTQGAELTQIAVELSGFTQKMIEKLSINSEEKLEEIITEQLRIIGVIREVRRNLIKSIKKNDVSTKNSMLILNILSGARNILNYSINMMKIQSDFAGIMKN